MLPALGGAAKRASTPAKVTAVAQQHCLAEAAACTTAGIRPAGSARVGHQLYRTSILAHTASTCTPRGHAYEQRGGTTEPIQSRQQHRQHCSAQSGEPGSPTAAVALVEDEEEGQHAANVIWVAPTCRNWAELPSDGAFPASRGKLEELRARMEAPFTADEIIALARPYPLRKVVVGPLAPWLLKQCLQLAPLIAAEFNAWRRAGGLPPSDALRAIALVAKFSTPTAPTDFHGIAVGALLAKLYAAALDSGSLTMQRQQAWMQRGSLASGAAAAQSRPCSLCAQSSTASDSVGDSIASGECAEPRHSLGEGTAASCGPASWDLRRPTTGCRASGCGSS
ncbi:hypothetical protein ABPG77_010482 [Micractinium sp. CCAP 211/92]